MDTINKEKLNNSEAGAEFYEAAQAKQEAPKLAEVRKFPTQAEREAHADKAKEIIQGNEHNEAGVPLPNVIPELERPSVASKLINFQDKKVAIEELRNSNMSAFDQMQGLTEVLESNQNDLEKAA